jgi:hypothetical protein
VQNVLPSHLLSKNVKTRILVYKNINFPVVLYGCETWSLTLREEHRVRVAAHLAASKEGLNFLELGR